MRRRPGSSVQVQVAVPDRTTADRICDAVVGERLAAAAQVLGPIRSSYWWRGEFNVAEEWLCVLILPAAGYEPLERRVAELHPYELPEIVALPIEHGSAGYLRWIEEETRVRDAE